MVVSLFLIGLLGACGSRNASDVTPVSDVQDKTVPAETVPTETGQAAEADMNTGSGTAHPVPSAPKNRGCEPWGQRTSRHRGRYR